MTTKLRTKEHVVSLVQMLREQGFRWKTITDRNPQHATRSALRVDGLVFVSAQLPIQDDLVIQGRVGAATTPKGLDAQIKQAVAAARLCAARNLFAAATAVKPDDILGVATMAVQVRSTDDFDDLARVAEGASTLLRNVLGERGVGARTEAGVATLPRQAMVQVAVTFIVT